MILTKLKEAKNIYGNLIQEIKQKNSKLAELRDTTINNIIQAFKKDQEGKELNANNVIDFVLEDGDFAQFVFEQAENISTYSISDFAEHDSNLAQAIKNVLRNSGIIDDEGRDLSISQTNHDNGAEDIPVRSLFNHLSEKPVDRKDAKDPSIDSKQLKGKTTFDLDDYLYNIKEVEAEYKKLKENLKEEHVCEKCGHSPCTCEDLADFHKTYISWKITWNDGKEQCYISAPSKEIAADLFKAAYPDVKSEFTIIKADESKVESIEDEKPVSEEPVEAPVIEEPHQDVPEAVFSDMINSAIQKEWDFISQINSLIATFDFDYKEENKEDITAIFNQLLDDTTINIGMLHKAAELVSSKQAELMDAGEEKAEQIISEPAQDLE